MVSDLCKKNKRNSNEEVVETKGKMGGTQEDSCKACYPMHPGRGWEVEIVSLPDS